MSITVQKIDGCPIDKKQLVKYTEMGNVLEVQYMSKRNTRQTIKMLPNGEYMLVSTGEVKECIKHETRADQTNSLCRTFKRVRGLINANVTDVDKVRWITLTYAENMTDTKQLYEDFKKFNMRFQYYCKKNGYGKAEYIVMMEPQGRGAWHAHLLYIFPGKAPYIANQDLAKIWGHGFVKIKKLENVDNVGAFLTAYLGDMELDERIELRNDLDDLNGRELKTVEIDGKEKRFIKGARLIYYPSNFNMYRASRGIKKPIEEMITLEQAEKKVGSSKLTFKKTIQVCDDENGFKCVIDTKQYNRIRK